MEMHFINNFQKPLNENIKAVHKTSTYDSLFPCIMQLLRAIIITITILVAAPTGFGALGLTIGYIAAVVDLISRMLAPIESIAVEFQTIQEAVSGLKRINTFDNLEEESRHYEGLNDLALGLSITKNANNNLSISMTDVSFSYGNGKDVVKNITLNINPGTKVAIAAKTVGLHGDIMKLPKGYDTLIGEGEIQLSYGQYQLLSLACALVCNPPILLLEEVTSGLDAITEQRIFKALKQISTNRTILTISHMVSGIIDADKVVILENGRIVETGTPRELVGRDGWYAKYNQIEELGRKI